MTQLQPVRGGHIVIDNNFNPDLATSYGKDHMRKLLNDWENNYHYDVHQVFRKLRSEYL
jgi:hypothetical protein